VGGRLLEAGDLLAVLAAHADRGGDKVRADAAGKAGQPPWRRRMRSLP
jgi:hypothetical protein